MIPIELAFNNAPARRTSPAVAATAVRQSPRKRAWLSEAEERGGGGSPACHCEHRARWIIGTRGCRSSRSNDNGYRCFQQRNSRPRLHACSLASPTRPSAELSLNLPSPLRLLRLPTCGPCPNANCQQRGRHTQTAVAWLISPWEPCSMHGAKVRRMLPQALRNPPWIWHRRQARETRAELQVRGQRGHATAAKAIRNDICSSSNH